MEAIYRIPTGAVGQSWRVVLRDASGAPVRGLTAAGGTADLALLREDDAAPRTIALREGRAGEHRPGALREIDSERMPGLYELALPDDLFAAGARSAVVHLDLPPAVPALMHVELVAYDPYDPFALRLANFIRSTCHDHLSSAFYRVMPPSVRPMMDLIMEPESESRGGH